MWGCRPADAYADVRAATRNALILGGGTLAVVLVVAWWLANRITHPLACNWRQMRGPLVTAISSGARGKRADGEVGVLAHTFNQMLDTIEGRNEALRLSESRYRNLIDGAPEAIVVLDVEAGKFSTTTRGLRRCSGCRPVSSPRSVRSA